MLTQRFPTGGPCGPQAARYWAADAAQNSRSNLKILVEKVFIVFDSENLVKVQALDLLACFCLNGNILGEMLL